MIELKFEISFDKRPLCYSSPTPSCASADAWAVQGHWLPHDGSHLHQCRGVWRPGQRHATAGERHPPEPVPRGFSGRRHPVRHLLPHGAGQDAHADAGHGREEVQEEALQELVGLPAANLQQGGPEGREPGHGHHLR